MDIRHFFNKRKTNSDDATSTTGTGSDEICKKKKTEPDVAVSSTGTAHLHTLAASTSSSSQIVEDEKSGPGSRNVALSQNRQSSDEAIQYSVLDVGSYLTDHTLTDDVRQQLLIKPWVPGCKYNFKGDVDVGHRSFRYQWLSENPTWLVYSTAAKGALCRHCVLFRPRVTRGVQGAFITRAFTKYKDFHNSAHNHLKSRWHMEAVGKSTDFLDFLSHRRVSVDEKVNQAHHQLINSNRSKLKPILKTVIFCATHDLPIRGKESDSGVFCDLLDFRVDSGDKVLEEHFSSAGGNAKYTSHGMQNQIISTCSDVLKEYIINDVNRNEVFSVLADETADISGKEQLSIGIRYVDLEHENGPCLREDFIGFVCLEELDAKGISTAIISHLEKANLDLTNMVAQGYDGCSTMAGKDGGVSRLIRNKFPKAQFFIVLLTN